jgi:hypothetical protein
MRFLSAAWAFVVWLLWEFWYQLTFWMKRPAQCGHKTRLSRRLSAFGGTRRWTWRPDEHGHIPYCHDCLKKMTVPCACCMGPIFPGDPIRFAVFWNKAEQGPAGVVTIKHKPLTQMACLVCADTIAEFNGNWMPPEGVQVKTSPFAIAAGDPNMKSFTLITLATSEHKSPRK